MDSWHIARICASRFSKHDRNRSTIYIRNRLDIGAMMKLAGYTERGDFLYEMEKATGDRDWDRNVEKGQTFIIHLCTNLNDNSTKTVLIIER